MQDHKNTYFDVTISCHTNKNKAYIFWFKKKVFFKNELSTP